MEEEKKKKDELLTEQFERRSTAMIGRWMGIPSSPIISDQGRTITPNTVHRIDRLKNHLHLYVEPSKSIPVFASDIDVLVVGSGPAGLSAAVSSARTDSNLRVMLVEQYGCFGGVISTVGMETLSWYRYENQMNDVTGIGREMEERAKKMGSNLTFPFNNSPLLDADLFKIVADELVRESGIRPLLHTMVVDVIVGENENDKRIVQGVIVECKSGRMVIFAKRVIDCTGDADVAFLAGVRCKEYDAKDMMGVTSVFSVAGVNKKAFLNHVQRNPATYKDWSREWKQFTTGKEDELKSPYWDEEFVRAEKMGVISSLPANVSIGGTWSALTDAGEATNLNLVHQRNINGTCVEDLTRAEMEGRRQTLQAIQALKSQVPGFESIKLRNFSMTLGVRDTRKIHSRFDVRNQARFPDSIGIFPEFIDGYNILILPTTGRYFHVPYGACVPLEEDIDNLLVAGRCIGGDRTSHAAMRNMMACVVSGAGCGVAASVSIQSKTTTSQVDISLVQRELEKQNTRVF